MVTYLLPSCVFFLAASAAGQAINLRGKVTNPSGQAVSGAIVELLKRGSKDTTGADGMYAFNEAGVSILPGATPESMAMEDGTLLFRLGAPASLEAKAYDLHGNLLGKYLVPMAAAGRHAWNPAHDDLPVGMMIIRASAGAETRTFRHLRLGSASSGQSAAKSSARSGSALAKRAADVDTLKVTAAGYAVKKVGLPSYEATVNVALQTGSSDRWGGPGNPPAKSSGCGKTQGITSGKKTIQSGGRSREYIIDIPSNYNPATPYRLFYVSHWINGNAQAMADNSYYAIKTEANAAGKPSIFVAATGIGGRWGEEDHPLFDNLVAHIQDNLCIDTTRVFAIGYSFGGMISYSLSTNHQHKIRAVVGIAPANFNIWIPNPKLPEPIAWMQVHGLRDETCLWDGGNNRGGKYIVLEKAKDNGCTIPAGNTFPVWQSGPHFCYEFQGCKEGYPVKICTNNGTHSGAEKYRDSGESSSWVPKKSWEFFLRF